MAKLPSSNPLTPICDQASHLYNVPMHHKDEPMQLRSPSGDLNGLVDVYRCAAETCTRHFDPEIGYFFFSDGKPIGPIRGSRMCDCQMPPRVLAIVKVHEDRRTVTYGCLRCGRTEVHEYTPCP